MDEKKICFIICVSDEALYRESQYYISKLDVPESYKIECIAVRNSASMALGYNKAMLSSDAKYKVYLQQDVFILNENIIDDLLDIFFKNNNIGMIAVAGGNRLLPNGIWQNSLDLFGQVYDNSIEGNMERHCFGEVTDSVKDIQSACDILFATQYDIPFRDDLFNGWYFYGESESMEFLRKGYRVVVPRSLKPWCMHLCGTVSNNRLYEHYRKIFLTEYSKDLFPLVSILIPAYNQTHFLKSALESAICQTYVNTEIIVGDDSTNDEVENFIQPYLASNKNIRYFRNGTHENDFGLSNVQRCINESKSEYISFIFHDDLAEPEKTETMMAYAITYPNVSLITSAFKYIDSNGIALSTFRVFEKDVRLGGSEFIRQMVQMHLNMVGAPSAAIFKKTYLNSKGFQFFGEHEFCTNDDMAMWLSALEHGEAIYIAKPLSCFRISQNQNSRKPEILIGEQSDWLKTLFACKEKGYMASKNEYKTIICKYISTAIAFVGNKVGEIQKYSQMYLEFHSLLSKAVNELFSGDHK